MKGLGKISNYLERHCSSPDISYGAESMAISSESIRTSRRFKAWIYRYSILPRYIWPLLIYEVPMTIVEGLEWNIIQFLCRWLGLLKSLSSTTAPFKSTNRLQFLFTRLCNFRLPQSERCYFRTYSNWHHMHWNPKEQTSASNKAHHYPCQDGRNISGAA